MKITPSALRLIRRSIGLGLTAMVCGQAFIASAQNPSEKQRRYEADRQVCLSGKSNQTFDSCIKEAKAALKQPTGAISAVGAEQFQRNAMLRCDALTGDERTACVGRMHGEGTVSGSVAGGGVLREIVTTELVPPEPQKPASSGLAK